MSIRWNQPGISSIALYGGLGTAGVSGMGAMLPEIRSAIGPRGG